MGRRKIEIKAIKDDKNRSVTFLKRKGGLLKKAHELSVLCSVDVAVIIFGNNKKLYEYSSVDIGEILTRYQYYEGTNEHKGPTNFSRKGKVGDNEDNDDGSGSSHHGSVEPQMMPPQFQGQPAFQYVRHRTPSASPQIPNDVLKRHPNSGDLPTHVQGQLMQDPPQINLQAGPQYRNSGSGPLYQQQLYTDVQGRASMPPAFPQYERPQYRLESSSLQAQQVPQKSQHEPGQRQSIHQMIEPVRRTSMKPHSIFSPFEKSYHWASSTSNVKASHSDAPSSNTSQSVDLISDAGATTSASNFSSRSTNEPAVPPLPLLSATALLSADATGPPKPFARPQHQVLQKTVDNIKYFMGSPVSPLPSRFTTNEFVSSPSNSYTEWIFGNTLNLATPIVGTGLGFLGDDSSERGENGDWQENTKRKPQQVDNRMGKNVKRAKHKS